MPCWVEVDFQKTSGDGERGVLLPVVKLANYSTCFPNFKIPFFGDLWEALNHLIEALTSPLAQHVRRLATA